MISLYIDGNLCDLNRGGADIRLTRKLTEVANFETRSGEFSFTISLPKTKVNNSIFEYSNEPHQENKFRRPVNFGAELFINGQNILNGFFKLSSVTPDSYTGNLYGISISWADLLEAVNLRELNWEIPYIGPGAGADQIDGYNAAENSPVRFPLISYFPFPNTNPVTASNRIIDANSLFTVDQLPPMVSFRETVRRLFAEIGWGVSGSFFASDWFKSLYIPFTEGPPPPLNYKTLGGVEGEKFNNFVNFPFTDTTPPDDPFPLSPAVRSIGYEFLNMNDNITLISTVCDFDAGGNASYDVKYNGRFTFEIELLDFFLVKDSDPGTSGVAPATRVAVMLYDTTNPATLNNALIDNYLDGTVNDIDSDAIIGFYELSEDFRKENKDGLAPVVLNNDYQITLQTVSNYAGQAERVKIQFPVNLVNGQNIRVLFVTYVQDDFILTPADTGYRFEGGVFLRVNPNDDINLKPAKTLPDINGKDFIRAFINQFNLWFTVDSINKNISFFPFSDFHGPEVNGVDLNCFNAIENATFTPNAPPKEIQLKYKADEKDIRTPGEFGDFTQTSINVYATAAKTITSLFASTVYLDALDQVNSKPFKVAAINAAEYLEQGADNPAFIGGFVPRLLQWVGTLTGGAIPVQGKTSVVNTNIGLTTFDGSPPASEFSQTSLNLMFNNSPGLTPGLYELFYSKWIDLLEKSYVFEFSGRLTADEYRRLQLDTPIVYNTDIWFLLEITGYSPATGDARIKMIKKVI